MIRSRSTDLDCDTIPLRLSIQIFSFAQLTWHILVQIKLRDSEKFKIRFYLSYLWSQSALRRRTKSDMDSWVGWNFGWIGSERKVRGWRWGNWRGRRGESWRTRRTQPSFGSRLLCCYSHVTGEQLIWREEKTSWWRLEVGEGGMEGQRNDASKRDIKKDSPT